MTNTANVENVNVKKKKKRKSVSLEKKKSRAGWFFVLPFVVGLVLIYLPIIFESLKSTVFYPGKNGEFYGFGSYIDAFTHKDASDFAQTLVEGVGGIILDIPMILLFSLFMAVLLNQKMAGRAAFRAIFFVPVIISTGVIARAEGFAVVDTLTDATGVNDGSGQDATDRMINAVDMTRLFSGISVTEGMLGYVTDAINNIFDIVNRSGVQMLIFLAGLQSISPAIYESVQIDGASAWETFWKITFPMISPMILVNAVYTVIDAFVVDSSVMSYITGLKGSSVPMPAQNAMSWIYFLLVIAILGIVVAVLSARTFYQRKK